MAPGVKNVAGDFVTGDSIDIVFDDTNEVLAKGICQYSSNDLRRIMGKQSHQIAEYLGFCPSNEIVHRDDMVLVESQS